MKSYVLLIVLLAGSFFSYSQGTHWRFEVASGEMLITDRIFGDLYISGKQYALKIEVEGNSYSYIVDSAQGKGMLLTTNAENKEARIVEISNEPFDLEADGGYDLEKGIDYKLLNEKKTIHGLSCQKINLLNEEGTSIGSAWVASGIHLRLYENGPIFDLEDGTVVEMEFRNKNQLATLKLLTFEKNPTFPAGIFSLEIPAGYTDVTLEYSDEEYYDDEEYDDEEGESGE